MKRRRARRTALAVALVTAAATVGICPAGTAVADAAVSYWTVQTRPLLGASKCLTAGGVGVPVLARECTGAPAQDWAFVNASGGQFLVSRGSPGYALGVTSLSAGASLVLAVQDQADRTQVFVAGDPVEKYRNHLRPLLASGLCLQLHRRRGGQETVQLARCGAASTGDQAWVSTFTGNH